MTHHAHHLVTVAVPAMEPHILSITQGAITAVNTARPLYVACVLHISTSIFHKWLKNSVSIFKRDQYVINFSQKILGRRHVRNVLVLYYRVIQLVIKLTAVMSY